MARSEGEGTYVGQVYYKAATADHCQCRAVRSRAHCWQWVRGLRDYSMMWYLEVSLPLKSRVEQPFNGRFVNLAGCQLILRSALSFASRPSPLVPFPTPQPFSPM